jgi:CubicO group peptidase (beta-lactamase class C family)
VNGPVDDDPLAQVLDWPATATAGWVDRTGRIATVGPTDRIFPWASVTKVVTALATWLAVEEESVAWEDTAGPPGATLAHLLAHASGLAPDGDGVLAPPGSRRIYSNRGIEVAAAHLADRTGLPWDRYASEGILAPAGLTATRLEGSPAGGAAGPLVDLLALARELLTPTVVTTATVEAATAVAFPGLNGVLPGFGRQQPNDWGLGVEVRGHKDPHWTGRTNPPETFGHFGRSGSFLWVDPGRGLGLAALADRPFGPWAADAWPRLADAVIEAWDRLPADPESA